MLPRVALRAVARPSPRALAPTSRHILFATSQSIRGYAAAKRPPPPVSRTTKQAAPPSRVANPTATGSVRQTSPGTSFPKDKTWKPQDGIKLGGPAAAASAQYPIGGVRPKEANTQNPLDGDAKAFEPVAQRTNADEVAPNSSREAAQEAQAAAENSEAPSQPAQPLPDLRQGIPSTFDFEFGSGKKVGETEAGQKDDKFDVASWSVEEQSQKREKGEREYERADYETSVDRRRAYMANVLYASIFGLAVAGTLYLARPFDAATEEVPNGLEEEDITGWTPGKLYARARARMGHQVGYYTEPTFPKLLPDVPETQRPPFTLVMSLEDLLVFSTWDRTNGYRMAKRPGVDYFIRYLSQYYELVLFTSAPMMNVDPIMKKLDPYHFVMWNLGREATKYEKGEYVKDLSYLNRPLDKTIIIDTHAPHVKNQPENAIILPKWRGEAKDPHAKDLVALIPFLEYVATMGINDVRDVLKSFEGTEIPAEFARREAIAREKFLASYEAEKSSRPRRSLGSLGSALGIKPSPAMGGGMVLADGQSVAEGLAKGKMLSDQIREQGQKQYEHLEKQIRENGAQWLKEEEEAQKAAMEAQMKDMKKGAFSWFGGAQKD
ncbi:Hypothetical protein R9X50_00411000 [Acrodontium crateriforme]|uniref:Mitochondrial import inner membrane translocase subunit TIM50 n=1 Tax=Acrodontium crateriforme TaxID=150365 RepID=A0AAQ3M3R6_9PEZI|nr:Hypothetical protein R9X50_00411000 [Acrodontium crateriforme]